MDFNVRAAIGRFTMDINVIKVTRCKRPERSEQLRNAPVKGGRGILQPLRHNKPLPEHPARSTDGSQRNILSSHKELIEPVSQIEGTINGGTHHSVNNDVLARDWRLRRYGRSVQLVEGVYNAPTPSGFLHTKCGAAVRRFRLSHVARLLACCEEGVDGLDLVPRQWPLPGDTIFCARHEINLVLDTLVRG